jgi:hypothetical protein
MASPFNTIKSSPYDVAMYASVFGLDLATGVKEMLIKNGFASVDTLLETPPAELAIMLGIDLYIARLIYHAAKRHTELERFVTEINEEEMVETNIENQQQKHLHTSLV